MSYKLPAVANDFLGDFVGLAWLTYLTSLLLELFKPGLISNFFDLNLLLVICLGGLAVLLLFGRPSYRPTTWQKWLTGFWALAIGLLLWRWLLKNATSNSIYQGGLISLAVIIISAIYLYKKRKKDGD